MRMIKEMFCSLLLITMLILDFRLYYFLIYRSQQPDDQSNLPRHQSASRQQAVELFHYSRHVRLLPRCFSFSTVYSSLQFSSEVQCEKIRWLKVNKLLLLVCHQQIHYTPAPFKYYHAMLRARFAYLIIEPLLQLSNFCKNHIKIMMRYRAIVFVIIHSFVLLIS